MSRKRRFLVAAHMQTYMTICMHVYLHACRYITERPNSGLHLRLHLLCPDRDEQKCPQTAQYVKASTSSHA